MQGMTGFGIAEKNEFKVEIRSLNHRYMEISMKIPSFLMKHEIPMRNVIKERFARGKFDVTISLTGKQNQNVNINRELARGIYKAFSGLQKELSIAGDFSINFFSGYRELLLTEEPEFNAEVLYDTFEIALSQVEEMRKYEGAMLREDLLGRVRKLEDIQNEIVEFSKGAVYAHTVMLSKKLTELLNNVPIDEARTIQEVALMVQKTDITEELVRLKTHLRQLFSILSEGGVMGRKIDFILQEINRETNTIASKSDDIRIIESAIEIKAEIEKLREQVHNIQ